MSFYSGCLIGLIPLYLAGAFVFLRVLGRNSEDDSNPDQNDTTQ